MLFTHIDKNNIFISFNDLEQDLLKKISKELNNLDKEVINKIKEFIKDNELDNNFKRQKNYLSNLSTYIDTINNQYNLFLYILPKEIKISNFEGLSKKDIFRQIEKISIDIFKLYDKYINKENIKYKKLKEYKGDSFLELELIFYIQELNNLYNHLLNYKKSLHDKIICSDKQVGISIDSLNMLDKNPLNNYQFVKVSYQNDLAVFVISLIKFLKDKRLSIFRYSDNYDILIKIINKIENFLKKITTSNILKIEFIEISELERYFIRYKNSKEIQKNILIYNILKNIFFTQLNNGVFLFETIDLTKMFEAIVHIRLKHYTDKLYIGNEPHSIIGKDSENLNKDNYLLKVDNKEKIKQYPDFMIKEDDIYHIIDAKYKLYHSLFTSRDIFWQILIYAKLFNKSLKTLDDVEKVIIYPNQINIDISKKFDLCMVSDNIDIFNNGEVIDENVFDSDIRLLNIDIMICSYY